MDLATFLSGNTLYALWLKKKKIKFIVVYRCILQFLIWSKQKINHSGISKSFTILNHVIVQKEDKKDLYSCTHQYVYQQ